MSYIARVSAYVCKLYSICSTRAAGDVKGAACTARARATNAARAALTVGTVSVQDSVIRAKQTLIGNLSKEARYRINQRIGRDSVGLEGAYLAHRKHCQEGALGSDPGSTQQQSCRQREDVCVAVTSVFFCRFVFPAQCLGSAPHTNNT